MDELAIIERHLAEAERHLAEASRHVENQRRIVAELERDGLDASLAHEVLETFEQSYVAHKMELDRLVQEKTLAVGKT
ncbi:MULTISPECIES: hypothetical protein [unclassified Sinorhizobium]|uniref:hypothetical protein n=1 Tax=unclassified Sinorhizobium TaxID=2613772 RepID=UPI0024C25735|nr:MULTISPECIES: hypothetical protein [unclassified Sinorhizobium]MDK1373502.1 hypothetical protein [Sinorhizobium sp. 6-70]MDK1479737.1 hypothetical protein [Sinorhizobium sp. 6-117]